MKPEAKEEYIETSLDSATILEQVRSNKVETYQDGRKKIEELYGRYLDLLITKKWNVKKVADSKTRWQDKEISFPILAFETESKGPVIYIISGIHGEEPTGPNALAESIDILSELGQKKPVVLIPLCNPLGYFRNRRYLNKEKYADYPEIEGMSVGDSEHYLLDLKGKTRARRRKPANIECLALSNYLLQISRDYPPYLSLDFHGDVLVPKGYIYSQGKEGEKDQLAAQILKVLDDNGIPIQWKGKTRFGENITNGTIGPQKDGSIDELLSATEIIVNGKIASKLGAEKVLVLETPDADIPLQKRVKAYKAVISFLHDFIKK